MLADGEVRLRAYETVPGFRTEDNSSGIYTLTRDRIMHPTDEELGAKRFAAEAARGRGSGSCMRGSASG